MTVLVRINLYPARYKICLKGIEGFYFEGYLGGKRSEGQGKRSIEEENKSLQKYVWIVSK